MLHILSAIKVHFAAAVAAIPINVQLHFEFEHLHRREMGPASEPRRTAATIKLSKHAPRTPNPNCCSHTQRPLFTPKRPKLTHSIPAQQKLKSKLHPKAGNNVVLPQFQLFLVQKSQRKIIKFLILGSSVHTLDNNPDGACPKVIYLLVLVIF